MSKKNFNDVGIAKLDVEQQMHRMRTRSIGLGPGFPEPKSNIVEPPKMNILTSNDFETVEVDQEHVPKEISGKTIMTEHLTYSANPTKKSVTKNRSIGRKTAQRKARLDKNETISLNGTMRRTIEALRVLQETASLVNKATLSKRKVN